MKSPRLYNKHTLNTPVSVSPVPSHATEAVGWSDPRTGIRLAPGALQNWPTREDDRHIEKLKKSLSETPSVFNSTTIDPNSFRRKL